MQTGKEGRLKRAKVLILLVYSFAIRLMVVCVTFKKQFILMTDLRLVDICKHGKNTRQVSS
jgi:hypothetical protein